MVLLIASAACGILSLIAAFVLQFAFPGWEFFAGLRGLDGAKLANIDAARLRRRLSILLYALAFGLLALALALAVKLVTESAVLPLFFLLALATFNLVWYYFRKFDRNEYSRAARRAGHFFVISVNMLFLVLCLVFVR